MTQASQVKIELFVEQTGINILSQAAYGVNNLNEAGQKSGTYAVEAIQNVAAAASQASGLVWAIKEENTKKRLADLMNLTDNLLKKQAEFELGQLGQVDQFYNHIKNRAIGAELVVADPTMTKLKALELAEKLRIEERKRKEEEFNIWYGQSIGNQTLAIQSEYNKRLVMYKGMTDEKKKLDDWKERRTALYEARNEQEALQTQQQYVNAMLSTSRTLQEQISWKEKSLDLERKLADIGTKIYANRRGLSKEQEEDLKEMNEMADSARRRLVYEEKLKTQGVYGGIQYWAIQKTKDRESGAADLAINMMKTLERNLASSISRGITNSLFRSGKVNATDIAESFIGAILETGLQTLINQMFMWLAQQVISTNTQTTAATQLTVAGTQLQSAAISLQGVASGNGISESGVWNWGKRAFGGGSSSGSSYGTSLTGESIIDSMIGGMTTKYHRGGLIYAHGGLNLAPDEVPIIAQTGERVLSREQNKAYEAGTTINLTVQNNTGVPVKASGRQTGDKEFIVMLDQAMGQVIGSRGVATKAMEQMWQLNKSVTRR